jgi:hypothetical protein
VGNSIALLAQVLIMQNIFSSPARLRSRFLFAYAYCRHATERKMLCIITNCDRNL